MKFEEYYNLAMRTENPNRHTDNPFYAGACLAGEAGELVNIIKKVYRDQDGEFTSQNIDDIIDEAGDVLWHIALLAKKINVSLDSIASFNIKKLEKRYNLV